MMDGGSAEKKDVVEAMRSWRDVVEDGVGCRCRVETDGGRMEQEEGDTVHRGGRVGGGGGCSAPDGRKEPTSGGVR